MAEHRGLAQKDVTDSWSVGQLTRCLVLFTSRCPSCPHTPAGQSLVHKSPRGARRERGQRGEASVSFPLAFIFCSLCTWNSSLCCHLQVKGTLSEFSTSGMVVPQILLSVGPFPLTVWYCLTICKASNLRCTPSCPSTEVMYRNLIPGLLQAKLGDQEQLPFSMNIDRRWEERVQIRNASHSKMLHFGNSPSEQIPKESVEVTSNKTPSSFKKKRKSFSKWKHSTSFSS